MRIYETQRIQLNNNFLIYKGRYLERACNKHTDKSRRKELKIYSDFLRSKFEDDNGEKLENVICHYTDEEENFLIIFPIPSSEDNIYEMYFDNIKKLYYFEITECN